MTTAGAAAARASGATRASVAVAVSGARVAGATEAARSVCVQFLPECLGKGFWDLPEMRRIGRLLKRAERGLAWDAARARGVAPLIVEIFQAKGASRMAKLLEALEALSTLGGAQVLASESCQTAGSTVVSGRINRVLEYLHANLSGRVETGVAARRSGLSKSGFARFFRRYMGRSFNDYVIGQRLAEARRLLAGTDRTVAQICFDCGFENLSNFNRLFRARTNATPSAYRRRVNGSTATDR
jgi:AraC-like DNA-binding protein